MVFDVSFGEFVVVGAAAFLLLGRKQMAAGAFVVGRGMGRAVGFVNRGREAVGNIVSSQELSQVNNELSEGFRQFSNVRRELQSMRLDPVYTIKSAILSSQNKQTAYTETHQNSPQPASAIDHTKVNFNNDGAMPKFKQFGSGTRVSAQEGSFNFHRDPTPKQVDKEYTNQYLDNKNKHEHNAVEEVPGPKAARRYVNKSVDNLGASISDNQKIPSSSVSEGVDIVLDSIEELRLLEEYEKFAALEGKHKTE